MKHLTAFKLFENLNNPIGIEQFISNIGIPSNKRQRIIEWWNQNRSHIRIHYFSFSSPQPIAGVFLGVDEIAINQRLPMPPHVKLFLSLHESAHCDQHRQERFMEEYYNTVVRGDKETFLQNYRRLEREANDFAINSMREIGFEVEMRMEEQRLRSNEGAGEMVYGMMRSDISRLNPTDFIDLLKKQIL